MSASAITQPPVQAESKSAKKKKAKLDASAQPKDVAAQSPVEETKQEQAAAEAAIDGSTESPYLRELHKSVRNVKKKLAATQKVDSIVAENPGKSLDELLASRKINADQKAQAEKKPGLQAQLAQLEDQLSQYKKFDEDYQKRFAAEKASLEASHREELEAARQAVAVEVTADVKREAQTNLLSLSKFLRAAASKRQDGDETAEENRAFEGALLLVYGGDMSAVSAMTKLVEGSDDLVPTVEGTPSQFSFKFLKDSSDDYAPASFAAEEAWTEGVAAAEPTEATTTSTHPVVSDPTLLHAGLTELSDEAQKPTTNGLTPSTHHLDTPSVPEASNIDAGAANTAGESDAYGQMSASATSNPDGWVEVARDPAETDTGITATPAAVDPMTQSWAEDVPTEPMKQPESAAPVDDGFQEVAHREHHGRSRGGQRGGQGYRGRGDGEFRGRGGRGGPRGEGRGGGEYRGRGGFRGEGRGGERGEHRGGGGRGRGGPRGGRGGGFENMAPRGGAQQS